MSTAPRVASINVSAGGVPKHAVSSAAITTAGVEGDHQRNRALHGGPDRAVCLFALERIAALQEEGHPIAPGSTGENLTLAGLDWAGLAPGARLRAGGALLEIVSYVEPCAVIRASFHDGRWSRLAQPKHPGWSRLYARVLEPGRVTVGDPVSVLSPADEKADGRDSLPPPE